MNAPLTARFPPLTDGQMTSRQREVAAAIMGGPRGDMPGPFRALIYHPELADRIQQLGAYLRYGSTMSAAQIELIALSAARHYNCQYLWYAHEQRARQATDLPDHIIRALALGQTPNPLSPAEAALHALARESLSEGQPSDATYQSMVTLFGQPGVLDAVALTGYYSLMALVLNTSQVPLPPDVEPPLSAKA